MLFFGLRQCGLELGDPVALREDRLLCEVDAFLERRRADLRLRELLREIGDVLYGRGRRRRVGRSAKPVDLAFEARGASAFVLERFERTARLFIGP